MKFVLYYVLFLNVVAIIPSFCEIENFEDDEEKLSDLDIESTKETVETLVFDKVSSLVCNVNIAKALASVYLYSFQFFLVRYFFPKMFTWSF